MLVLSKVPTRKTPASPSAKAVKSPFEIHCFASWRAISLPHLIALVTVNVSVPIMVSAGPMKGPAVSEQAVPTPAGRLREVTVSPMIALRGD